MPTKRRARTYPEKVLKVVNTGEHGAVNIYRGQIWGAALTCPTYRAELADFMAHEQRHRRIFQAEPSYLLCGLGGLVLGLVTGLMGRRAIAVTTVAVERVVLMHLEEYQTRLTGVDEPARSALTQIVDDEQEHHDAAAREAGKPNILLRLLGRIVSLSTEGVIWTGMRL